MSDKCSCKKMEEKIYWTHFQTVHFFLMLPGHDQVAIPEKFAKHYREKLGKLVYLKIPSGAKWNVGLVVDRGSLCFKLGWREFMEDNSLQKGDILILKYNGSVEFDVQLFDRQSLCEKEASYFVKNCEHATNKPREEGKRKDKETAKETTERRTRECPPVSSDDVFDHDDESLQVRSESSDDCTDWTPSKRPKKEHILTPTPRRRLRPSRKIQEEDIVTHPEQPLGTSGKIRDEHNDSTPLVLYSNPEVEGTFEVCTEEGNISTPQVVEMTEIRRRPLEFISNRRPISEQEKHNVELMANKETSESDVVVILKEYQVYRDFFLTIPAWWVQEHLPPKTVDVRLQVGLKSWRTKYMKRSTGGMLTTGWRKFALDNCLEEYDACIFKLAAKESDPVVIDVTIFRVVDEVVPPTLVQLTSGRQRGRKSNAKPRRKWR